MVADKELNLKHTENGQKTKTWGVGEDVL